LFSSSSSTFQCQLKSKCIVGNVLIIANQTHSKESYMKKLTQILLVTVLLSTFFFGGSASTASATEPKILEFDTMVGVPAGLTGTQSLAPLRDIRGGGVPWVLSSANGELSVSGHLEIEVQGLVLATTGSNPAATFRGLVSCVKSDGTFENIRTDPFPATTGLASAGGGNAKIEADLIIPQPCIAPIIFVTSAGTPTNPTISWFAATGF
jgi:hypothetical protein